MSYFYDGITTIVLFIVFFGVPHSLLASNSIKEKIKKKAAAAIAFYRLFYNVISLLAFWLFYKLSPKPHLVLYDLSFPYDIIIVTLQMLALGGIIWAGSQICMSEFLGIAQIKRFFAGNYNPEELDESTSLTFSGPYSFSRHPIYLFSILFLLFRPSMNFFYAVMLFCIVAYFYIGSFFEEKKLLQKYGELYADYQKSVSKIFPVKFKRYRIEG